MSSALKSKGVSLSAIFDPYVAGTTKARATGINDDGTDTSDLYANIIYGSAAAATGIKSENADLNTLYAKVGTASYSLPFEGQIFVAHSNLTISEQDADIQVRIKSDGTYDVISAGNSTITPEQTGPWLPAGASVSDYQVQFAYAQNTHQGSVTITNGAATLQACTTTRTMEFHAVTESGATNSSKGTLTISLKRLSTGVVSVTDCGIDILATGNA